MLNESETPYLCRSGSSSSRSRSRDRTSRDRSSRDRGGEHFKTGQEKREAKVKKLGMVVADPVTGQGKEIGSFVHVALVSRLRG